MIEDLRSVLGSRIKALEMLFLIEGIKPAARIMASEEKKEEILGFLKERGLCFSLSDFKVRKEESGDYSDKGFKMPDSEKGGHRLVYISKEQEVADEAKKLESEGKHKELGALLGYPSCCSSFFAENFPMQSKKSNDYTMLSLANSNGFHFPFYTNICARHFDFSLLSHFPCSFNCEKSIEIAKRNFEAVRKYDGALAKEMESMLKTGVVYSEMLGVFLLKNARIDGRKMHYKGLIGTKDNQLAALLKAGDYVEIIDKNRFRTGGLEVKNAGVMAFLRD